MAKTDLRAELERLRNQLEEAQETLEAIRTGAVDALVVAGSKGEQVYTLRGADHTYRLLLQEMNEGAATLMPDGTILYCNSRFAGMLKKPMEQLIGSSMSDLVAPGDRPLFAGLISRGEQDRAKAEVSFSAAGGGAIPVYCSVSPLEIDGQECLCLVATDLAEQKRSEAILASEKLARHILERAVDVIVVCNEHGVITHASRAAHELAGTNVLQQSFESVFPLIYSAGRPVSCATERAHEENGSFVSACLGGRTMQGMEVELQRADGKKFDLLMSAGPLRDMRQESRGCVFTLTDITRLKKTEEALRQSEQKLRQQAQELERQLIATGRLVSLGEITASMAHEFNNPLGIIMGFAEDLLSEKVPSSPDYQGLKIIHAETKRCEKIIRDLLQFARPRPADFGPTEVRSLIAGTVELVDNHLYKQKIVADIRTEENLSDIHADRQQLEQVLVNLYLNAIDAMPDGGKLTVESKVEAGEVVISISDSGIGIDPEDLPRIFQPFFSARKKRGLGLGLSICDRIIRNHGGRIEVESCPHQGATFRIYLPLRPTLTAEEKWERSGVAQGRTA
jgi:PAS domain S-box-containing protein